MGAPARQPVQDAALPSGGMPGASCEEDEIYVGTVYPIGAFVLLLVLVLVVNTLRCGTKTGGGQPGALPPREKVDHYADTLSQMIACNTVTVQPGGDMSPIYAMHQKLEELFPLIHQKLEKHDIDGALLFKWAGKDPSRPPILLMSHMDVVPATGDWILPAPSPRARSGAAVR